ncbi:MAG: chorismate synthase [Actinobacteria bacterium]|nr:chorismate synthase [Actinomycetota bacterium]
MRYVTAGESHGRALTAIISDVPAGIPIDQAMIDHDLARRQVGYGRGGRMRIERDRALISAGVRLGSTIGSPIALTVANRDWDNWTDVMQAQALDEIEVIVEQPAETSPTPVPEEIVEPAAIPSSELFTFRDIFKPVIRPSAAVTPGAVATGTAGVDRLTLVNIVVEDGVPNVVVDLNGVTHTLAAGESIAGTPWMVRSIADRSATFAYGDASIRLAVGVGAVVDPNEPGVITPVGK